MKLEVTPGDVTVPKGSDVIIQAVAFGIDPRRAQVHLRYANGTDWEVSTMEPSPQNQPTFRHLLFNVQEAVHYFVDADAYRSKEFTINVADLPKVEKVDYAYHYPAYTGLAVKKEENGSDIVALKNTEVDVTVTGSQALSGGRIVFADGKSVALQPTGERTVMGRVTVDRNTTFRIELTNTSKAKYLDLEERSMEALDDQKPIVEFTKPGRDTKATKVEEVFTELRAEDDFGVRQLELHFSVNGGPDQKVDLFDSKGNSPKEISASHTFFLEEYNLVPGDIITYYGKAVDTKTPGNTVSTDVYFIDVRPFGREFRQAQGGGGGGGGQDDSAQALSQRQRQIIAATHKLINNKDKYKEKEWIDDIHSIASNQTKNAEQTNTLIERMNRRGLTGQDKMIAQMAQNLKSAIEQMTPAADQLKAEKADAAEPFEQKALQYLMRAEALFNEIQVSQGGGGGGGGAQNAQDIADLFELELDQNKNQYETVQRGEQQQNSPEVDEALRKLKELAERQQKLQQRKAQQQQTKGGGGSGDQMAAQDLQKETERLARQLDKLSRENNDRRMEDASRALQQAAQAMQQAQSGSPSQQQQAAQNAQEQLQKAQQLLSQGKNGSMEDRLAKVQEQSKRLKDEQSKIANETQQLANNPGNSADARRRAQEINQQKDGLASDLKAMTNELEALGNNSENRDASNRARTAVNTIKSQQLQENIEQGRQFLNDGTPQNNYYKYAEQKERQIEKGLDDVSKQIGQAAAAANNSEEKKLQNALNQTGETIQSLESMKRRLEQLQQQNQQNQPGQRPGQQPGQQPNGQQPGQQPNGQQPGQQPNGQQPGQQPNGQQPGQQPNGQQPGQQPNSQQPGQQPNGQQPGQQPNGQQPGQQPNGQQPGGQQRGGGQPGDNPGSPNGYPNGSQYSTGNFDPRQAGNFDPRQAVRELQQRYNEIRDLQNQLGPKSEYSQGLDQVARNLQALINDPKLGDPRAIDKLEQQVIDPFKGVELELSKKLQILLEKDNIRSAQEDEIPQGYQKLVEDYYKKLASPKP